MHITFYGDCLKPSFSEHNLVFPFNSENMMPLINGRNCNIDLSEKLISQKREIESKAGFII